MKRVPIILGLLASIGCASAPELPKDVRASRAATVRVQASVESADEEAGALDAYEISVRYNPARCDCPDFEVEVYGGWQRAYIVAPPRVETRLEEFRKSSDSLRELALNGRLTTTTRRAETGVDFPVFEVEEGP